MPRLVTISILIAVVVAPVAVVVPAGAAAVPLCAGVPATIVGTPHAEHLIGTASRDVIVGKGGADVIDGRGGNDLICAGGGRDVVLGGEGSDEIYGGRGPDLLRGGSGNDTLIGGTRADTLFGGSGADVLRGGGGADTLIGNGGSDTASGGSGVDWCRTSETTSPCRTTAPTGPRMAAMAAARLDPTYGNIGFEWKMTGDTDHDSWLFLEYRAAGADRWLPAAPSMRAYPEAIVNGAPLGLDHHAASAMFLKPDTRYEIRATITDLDGGAATTRRAVRTRRQWYRSGGTIRYVVPGSGGGAGTAVDPYRGLQAAADAAQPGFIVNNTGAQNGNAFTGQAGWQNAVLRNNIFLGTRYAFEFTSASPGGSVIWTTAVGERRGRSIRAGLGSSGTTCATTGLGICRAGSSRTEWTWRLRRW